MTTRPTSANGRAATVEVRIETLVLDGFASGDCHAISAAVQGELNRLFTERGVPPALLRDAARARLRCGSFEIPPEMPAAAIGAHIARALYQGFSR